MALKSREIPNVYTCQKKVISEVTIFNANEANHFIIELQETDFISSFCFASNYGVISIQPIPRNAVFL